MHPPTLHTERLILEPLRSAHSAGMFELWSSPEVCAHSGDAEDWHGNTLALPATAPATSDAIIDCFEHRAAENTGFRWAVVHGETKAFIGAVGFNSIEPAAELAYHQIPEYWGSGYMLEACTAAIGWGKASPATAVVAYIDAGNLESVRLAHRLGFQRANQQREGADLYILQ